MKPGLKISALLLLCFICTVLALRNDLSQRRLREADRAFHAGDLHTAQSTWSSATMTTSSPQMALLNRGIARYRLGDLFAAGADFRAAAASNDVKLRQQALYNLGTTLLVREHELKTADRQEAQLLLGDAVRHLQAAVTLNPADADACHNTSVAQERLHLLAGEIPSKHPRAEPAQQPQDKKEQGTAPPKQPGQAAADAGKPGVATGFDAPVGRRRTVPPLSSTEALRLLDEVRGRESLRSGVAAGNRHEKLTPPEKDW